MRNILPDYVDFEHMYTNLIIQIKKGTGLRFPVVSKNEPSVFIVWNNLVKIFLQ